MVWKRLPPDGEGAPDPEISSTEWAGKNSYCSARGRTKGWRLWPQSVCDEALEEQPITTDAGPIAVTLSAGVAARTLPMNSHHALLRAADRALYRAKDAGRNQIRRESSQRRGANSTLNGLLGVRQPRHPPSIEVTLVYPMATNDSAAIAER